MADLIPTVDVGGFGRKGAREPEIVAAVDDGLSRAGFLQVKGLDLDLPLQQAFAAARIFFAQPASWKQRCAYTDADSNFGYQGVEVESLDPKLAPDLKEAFTMRNAPCVSRESPLWPDAQFRDAALGLYDAALAGAFRMLEILATALELPPHFFEAHHRGENVTLRFLHYPAGLPLRTKSQLGAAAHTDYGTLTLLFQDDVGGLELRSASGAWVPATPVPDAVVINTGDLMERWSNGRYPSTLHRVRPMSTRERFSIALFVDPDAAVEVSPFRSCVSAERPARFAPITAGEHIHNRIVATHGA